MRSIFQRIALASSCGAFCGTLIGLEVAKHGWLLGMITGAVIGPILGYLVYDLRELKTAGGTVWREWRSHRRQRKIELAQTADYRRRRRIVVCKSAVAVCKSAVALWPAIIPLIFILVFYMVLILVLILQLLDFGPNRMWPHNSELFYSALIIGSSFFFACIFAASDAHDMLEKGEWSLKTYSASMQRLKIDLWKATFYINPLTVACFWIPVGIARGFWFCGRIVRDHWRDMTVAVKRVLVLIHSSGRLLSCFNATCGVTIGYFCGSPVAGLMGGLVLTPVTYYLVAKNMLGVSPNGH